MPIIHFTAADALQTRIVPAEIYQSEVTRLEGPSKSTSGKSTNVTIDITITEGKFKGKARTIMFSSGVKNQTMQGEMQFFPYGALLDLDAAISGREVTPEDYPLDTDNLLHRPFDAAWGVTTVDGHLSNTINSFHPKGYGAKGPAF